MIPTSFASIGYCDYYKNMDISTVSQAMTESRNSPLNLDSSEQKFFLSCTKTASFHTLTSPHASKCRPGRSHRALVLPPPDPDHSWHLLLLTAHRALCYKFYPLLGHKIVISRAHSESVCTFCWEVLVFPLGTSTRQECWLRAFLQAQRGKKPSSLLRARRQYPPQGRSLFTDGEEVASLRWQTPDRKAMGSRAGWFYEAALPLEAATSHVSLFHVNWWKWIKISSSVGICQASSARSHVYTDGAPTELWLGVPVRSHCISQILRVWAAQEVREYVPVSRSTVRFQLALLYKVKINVSFCGCVCTDFKIMSVICGTSYHIGVA